MQQPRSIFAALVVGVGILIWSAGHHWTDRDKAR
jgi:hypothetical protein